MFSLCGCSQDSVIRPFTVGCHGCVVAPGCMMFPLGSVHYCMSSVLRGVADVSCSLCIVSVEVLQCFVF